MTRISDAYCSSLRDLGFGEPLWEPEPGARGQVECGDVGYITEGRFVRLFRATCPAGDPINKFGVPDGFKVLEIPEDIILTNNNFITPSKPICSRSVKCSSLSVGPQVHGVSVGYEFTCHSHIGAVSIPQHAVTSTRVERNGIFRRYIASNYMAWHAFALSRSREVHPTDLLLVSGHVKTTAWVLAAFTEQGVTHSVYLSAQGIGATEAEVGSFQQSSVIQRNGPKRDAVAGPTAMGQLPNELCDQCLFLRYYKVEHRFNIAWDPLRKIVAAAEPQDDEFFDDTEGSFTCGVDGPLSPQGEDEMTIEIQEVPYPTQENRKNDPIRHVLAYILRNSEATLAVASHDDLSTVWPDDWSTDLGASLQMHHPKIALDDQQVGYITAKDTSEDCAGPTVNEPSGILGINWPQIASVHDDGGETRNMDNTEAHGPAAHIQPMTEPAPILRPLEHTSPDNLSPSGSQVSNPEHPSTSTLGSIYTPPNHKQPDQQASAVGDYQRWIEDYYTGFSAGTVSQTGQLPAHIAFQDAPVPQPHLIPIGPQLLFRFIYSGCSTEALAPRPSPPATNRPAGYGPCVVPQLALPHLTIPSQHQASTSVQIAAAPTTSGITTMITPHYYDQSYQQAPDVGDYQQWVESYRATYPAGHAFASEKQTADPAHVAYQETPTHQQHSSMPVSSESPTHPAIMADVPQDQYHFGSLLYSTDAGSKSVGLPTPYQRPSTGKQPPVSPSAAANASKSRFVSNDSAAPKIITASKEEIRSKKRVRLNVEEESTSRSESEDDAAVPSLKGPDQAPTRLPSACTRCKRLKMKCHFPPDEVTCVRCKTSRHICVVEGRRGRDVPKKREYLLAQIRQKDAIIESLLKQMHNPYLATPMSIRSYRMTTSPSGQSNKAVLDWLERLEDSVRTAGGSGSTGAFAFGSSGVQGSTDEEEEEDDVDAEEREDEPTEHGSVGTVKVEEVEKQQSLPDAAVPLDLIAELALSSSGAKSKQASKGEGDMDDDDVAQGVANDGYFLPGPASDLKTHMDKDTLPEIIIHGLVTPDEVDKLFEIFFSRLNCHVSVLDPVLHTPATTFKRCPFLFTVVCAVASRYYKERPAIYPIAMHFAKQAAANALITGRKSAELVQAYIILSIYGAPARRWEEDRGWLYAGLAIGVATDLDLHRLSSMKPSNEMQERETLNRARTWINCYILDRSLAAQLGKPPTIKEDLIIRGSDDWYQISSYNHPYDIGLCAHTSQLRIVARFFDEVFSNPDSLTGLKEGLDFYEVSLRYDEALTRCGDDWTRRMRIESDMNDPACAFRFNLLPFLTNYSRLIMYSFGCQQAIQRRGGVQENDHFFVRKCFEAAKAVITSMVDSLAPSGFMRYAPDGHFVVGTFACAFLLELLKPEFLSHHLISKQQEDEIFRLIYRLTQTLQSPETAIDERHAPRLHARFLTGLLSRYERNAAMTGELRIQPPPTRHKHSRASHAAPVQQTAPLQHMFSAVPGAPDSDNDMDTSHSSQDDILTEPVFKSEAAYAVDRGLLDFDSVMGSEDEVIGALPILKDEAY